MCYLPRKKHYLNAALQKCFYIYVCMCACVCVYYFFKGWVDKNRKEYHKQNVSWCGPMGFRTRMVPGVLKSPKAIASGGCYMQWPTQMLILNKYQSHSVIQVVQGVSCQHIHRQERLLEAGSQLPFGKFIFDQKDSTEAFSKLIRERGAVFPHRLLGHPD